MLNVYFICYNYVTKRNLIVMKQSKIKTKEIQEIIKKQNRSHNICIFFILLILGLIAVFSYRSISHSKQQETTKKETAATTKTTSKTENSSQDSVLKPWYSYHSIAHALGGVDGKDYLNSLDGFYQAYAKGYRVFEMDLLLTTDNVLVGKHQWGWKLSNPKTKNGNAVSYQNFKNTKIYGKYTPTSLLDMFHVMDKYKDFYLMTDSKSDEISDVKKDFTTLVQTAKKAKKESLLDRMIIQVYNQEMFKTIKKIYPFKHFVYTTYKQRDAAFYKMVKFCKANGIEAVTSPQNDINDYRMEVLQKEGIYSYTHSVNTSYHTKEYMKLGVYGVYSDFLTPAQIDLAWIRANYSDFVIRFVKNLVPTYRNL